VHRRRSWLTVPDAGCARIVRDRRAGPASLEHLERYLCGSAQALASALAAQGASLDQFTGRVAAEFSWLDA
jgi:hypothetical protein